jgi:TPR repeat protein
MEIPFSNPYFNKDVKIVGSITNNKIIPIPEHITLKNGINTYYYIVNGVPRYRQDKLTIMCNDGKKYHYIIVDDDGLNREWVNESIKKGDAEALYEAGIYKRDLYFCGPSYGKQVIELWGQAAKKGHVEAMFELGTFYENEKSDIESAIPYYVLAAKRGHIFGANYAGYYYKNKGDYKKMLHFYKISFKKGDLDAAYYIAWYYGNIKHDYEKMVTLLKIALKSIAVGLTAATDLGVYYRSIGDYKNMKKYFNIGIAGGSCRAHYEYGCYYKDNKKYAKMVKMWESAEKYCDDAKKALAEYKASIN